jgi:hypothetical protein
MSLRYAAAKTIRAAGISFNKKIDKPMMNAEEE